ncbi:hypothetical protein [Bacillus wiedmannii]|uniref:hypothetical protein n=1 Tax=Bacillus wiedmannii TaxID=1890302 RepID=UPI000BEFA432|nr:hypothetical protein [Bacillus wiedmannii]PEM08493.1 hypothetical protein CN610_19765 [Bacillus wiedmannii]
MEKQNELKVLARQFVGVQVDMMREDLPEWEREELKQYADEIQMTVVKKGYSSTLFVQYIREYPELTVEEYMNWIKE